MKWIHPNSNSILKAILTALIFFITFVLLKGLYTGLYTKDMLTINIEENISVNPFPFYSLFIFNIFGFVLLSTWHLSTYRKHLRYVLVIVSLVNLLGLSTVFLTTNSKEDRMLSIIPLTLFSILTLIILFSSKLWYPLSLVYIGIAYPLFFIVALIFSRGIYVIVLGIPLILRLIYESFIGETQKPLYGILVKNSGLVTVLIQYLVYTLFSITCISSGLSYLNLRKSFEDKLICITKTNLITIAILHMASVLLSVISPEISTYYALFGIWGWGLAWLGLP